ncbi:ATP-binding protein, partial [Bradyrhizobium sp.]|uniref:ATP-binding protein n=1 Tax=Bradyrhizobium sp. TaxID=376 RepID=UPI003C551041
MTSDEAQWLYSSGLFGANSKNVSRVLSIDGERIFYRVKRPAGGDLPDVLIVVPAAEHPLPATLDRLAHEFGLRNELDRAWACRPIELVRESGRTMLVLEDPGGEPLERLLNGPMETARFLRLAISIAQALGRVHQSGLIHKDLKPANILLNRTTGAIRFTAFGLASRLRRERLTIQPAETIAGTLAYMPPEQTGWMNRSLDSRSDLYALGVILYQMLTGSLPFAAADPIEWVHCHIARQPVAPAERVTGVPQIVSAIIMKLLAKTAEDRYQTATGLVRDLRRCLAELEARGRVEAFPLGQRDASDRLTIPEKFYGREREIETLLASFDRVVKDGTPELVLVSGYSGIGKSSIVSELHKELVSSRALFACGKFDQYKRDIPYATLAQAFRGLIQTLLSKSDLELAGWRDAFREALGDNGQLIVDLVPELGLVISDQAPVSELNPKDAQHRFQRVFRRFLGVFAQPEHPLALFLDDLQWLDAATLDLIEDLLTQPELRHLMLIGAYRDNEVGASHPFMRKLEAIRQAGARVQQIPLGPLSHGHLSELITDTLRCEPARALPLANLVQDKTAGNPFFAIQFLNALADEGLLTFDAGAGRWSWDIERLRAKGYTDNVVDLMVGRLVRLSEDTRRALEQFACLGAAADTETLAIVLETS